MVERMMRVSPADVFWLQERWRTSSRNPHIQQGKPARTGTAIAVKRRRALLWAGTTGEVPQAPVATSDDVDYELALGAGISTPAHGALRVHRYEGNRLEEFLLRVDESGDQPLDYVVGSAADAAVARACQRLDLGWVEACG